MAAADATTAHISTSVTVIRSPDSLEDREYAVLLFMHSYESLACGKSGDDDVAVRPFTALVAVQTTAPSETGRSCS